MSSDIIQETIRLAVTGLLFSNCRDILHAFVPCKLGTIVKVNFVYLYVQIST